ncbi:hypothetical protein H4R18_003938 [Coemansia javaensis]|uniref:Chitin-binding type-2 domain-containing protein n=1 Tax=Coemansia javaensis TaxID=2761396 RepID=A0A9W8HCA7_9FUNG|nr:hypothetical protein H4R18_003938 [Coemansia javaensis]
MYAVHREMLRLLSILLLATLLAATAHAQQGARCSEGRRQCQGPDRTSPYYYRCNGGVWTLYTCGNGYTCTTGGGGGAACVPSNPAPPPICVDGQRRCIASGDQSFYYRCNAGAWTLYTCGSGFRCTQLAPLQATCTPAPPMCMNGAQRCAGPQSPGVYFACANGAWSQRSCNPGDRCIDIPGGTVNCQVAGARIGHH